MSQLNNINELFVLELSNVSNFTELFNLKAKFLGKKSLLAEQISRLATLTPEEKRQLGTKINTIREYILKSLNEKQKELEELELIQKLNAQSIDITLPGRGFARGKIHPITNTINELKNIFARIGFAHVEGQEIEDDWNNFTALNINESHPARQMHDTFYMQNVEGLLRTHTSGVQIRYMEKNQPPIRVISSGRVYRSDYDATHTPMFHQLEGLVIGEEINFGHLKGCISQFLKAFFRVNELAMRWRSSYFPFTEPSAEIDIKCDRSAKKEIKIGEGNDWLEILGCGMVHEKVLKNVGIDPMKYQGFAFGVGIERLTMLKHNIPDLRIFFEGDIRWHEIYGI
ncbi:MAG: phenylalanine--tRNA ligase subunit alpha [Candidatus Midichloria sp.]|nr:MAG: phenylalanine--tRNA ligase subunit alpha [Candidatus Midichloria sp.]